MQVSDLEELSAQLHQLRDQLHASALSWRDPLAEGSLLVQRAKECNFMLPKPLTLATLAETVDRKIANVTLLLERARTHADLPEAAQMIADHECLMSEADYRFGKHAQAAQESIPAPR